MWWLFSQLCCCCGRDKVRELSAPLPDEDNKGGPDWGYAVTKNDRIGMEDAVSVVENVAGFRFFAVYDGHAGSEAVLAAKKVLPEKMASCQYAGKMAICSAFKAADEELVKLLQGSPEQEITSGTVVCVALVKGKDLWIANLGDCRAVACKENKAETITFDHSPVKNEAEVKRLQQLGVAVSGGYVGDHVAVSRALGNFQVKTRKKVEGISSDPEVFHRELGGDLDFLLLGSGIWDVLKEQFALTHERKALQSTQKAAGRSWRRQSPVRAAFGIFS